MYKRQLIHVSTIGKNLLSSNISSTRPHNMVNFGSLAAEIGLPVWGTPANFNGFRVWQRYCTAVKYWASAKLCGVQQRAPPMFGRRPSRWALAHILVFHVPPSLGLNAMPFRISPERACAWIFSVNIHEQSRARRLKVKFHYASWFGVGSKLV